jgi:hypothetical protein
MYLLTKYIKRVLWGVAVRLSYIQDVTGGMCETSGECSLC